MMHRSGFAYGFLTPPPLGAALLGRFGMGIASEMTPDAWLKSLAELPLVYQPGERFNYGMSIDVLGFVAARVLGTDLPSAMREKLFAPLGMEDTGFPRCARKALAYGHVLRLDAARTIHAEQDRRVHDRSADGVSWAARDSRPRPATTCASRGC